MTKNTMFTEEDFPAIMEALKQKFVYPINLNGPSEDFFEGYLQDEMLVLGSLDNQFGEELLGGNLTPLIWGNSDRSIPAEEFAKQYFRETTTNEGLPAIEVTYVPLAPYYREDDEAMEEFYNKTNLSTLMTLEQFKSEIRTGAKWTDNCFGTTDAYDLYFEVQPEGEDSLIEARSVSMFELLADRIPVEFNGIKYEVHTWVASC